MPNNRLYTKIERNTYYDSVTLMRCSSQLQAIAGIGKVALMMGTPANQALMAEQHLWDFEKDRAAPTDLCVSMIYESDDALSAALQALEDFISGANTKATDSSKNGQHAGGYPVHSWQEAAYVLDAPRIAAISVPGPWASAEARQALDAGFDVFLYSDNVPLAEELTLKRYACERERIVMGPDCGTALIKGAPLGFINRLRPGNVGIIAASGTGAQEVSTALDRAGIGISSIIGIGSRDLAASIGAMSFLTALQRLRDDSDTTKVAIVAKPPDPDVLAKLLPILDDFPKPIVALFLGIQPNAGAHRTNIVSTIGELIGAISGRDVEMPPKLPRIQPGTFLRGLFVGGTLAIQASYLLHLPLAHEGLTPWQERRHIVVDLGDDRFTLGRPHPMIDGSGRGQALSECLSDPQTGMVMGDIVLGDGAENDPAGHVITAIEQAAPHRDRLPPIVFTVIGTRQDPQNYDDQVEQLRRAGVWVTQTTAAAIAVREALGGVFHD
ncbi:MAG: transcriptional regulator [Sulfobacillus acidophilus]|uniref:Transcriptional regulator n=1 Tax=Sulfobacillus acidophilus TaxID=53633 RepID=A0A2T2WH22_9FIRM|nr:MAG: transcriptional regulator [Sulfobacillus acidophilus]